MCVFGDDYDTPDGTCIRDYVHVTDLADAHLLALEDLARGGESCAYNLGSEAGYSVLEIIRAASEVVGQPIGTLTLLRDAGRPGETGGIVREDQKRNWAGEPLGIRDNSPARGGFTRPSDGYR